MRTTLLFLALALALPARPAVAQSHHPGPVVLLGERADASLVPELARAPGRSLLLVAGAHDSPVPLDARAWGGDASTEVVQLTAAREADVDRALLARVRAARLVAFGPGAPREWLEALLDRERASALSSAIHEAWGGGATLVGRGDTAALLSAAFAVRDPQELDWDVRNPRDDGGPRAAQGLGYQPWAMVDTEARSSGSLQRLVRSVCREGIELALYLPAESSIVVDLTAARLRVHGTGEVLLIDTRGARRNRETVQGARLTLLPPGANWDAAERRMTLTAQPGPDPGADPGRVLRREAEDLHSPLDSEQLPAPGVTPWRRWIRDDGRRRLVLRYDESSRWGWIGSGIARVHWLEGLVCDLPAEGP